MCVCVCDAIQGAEYAKDERGADHTHGSGDKFVQDPLSLSSGPITRLRAKHFKEALIGVIQEKWADSEKMETKMGPNDNQGLFHVIKAIWGANYHEKT